MVRESQRRRYADVAIVDRVIELDQEWKAGTQTANLSLAAVPLMCSNNDACSYIPYGNAQDAAECLEQADWRKEKGQQQQQAALPCKTVHCSDHTVHRQSSA